MYTLPLISLLSRYAHSLSPTRPQPAAAWMHLKPDAPSIPSAPLNVKGSNLSHLHCSLTPRMWSSHTSFLPAQNAPRKAAGPSAHAWRILLTNTARALSCTPVRARFPSMPFAYTSFLPSWLSSSLTTPAPLGHLPFPPRGGPPSWLS